MAGSGPDASALALLVAPDADPGNRAAISGSDSALPHVVLPGTGQAAATPATDSNPLLLVLLFLFAVPGTLVMALIALVLVRR
jgi:hypothetical protein